MIKRIGLLLWTATALTVSGASWALSSDRDQPANIEADDIEFDFRKGTRTYTDNVLVEQGTLRLKADKLIGIYENGELANATAWGSLARFKQRPDGKQHDVEGWAKKIVVDQKNNTLTLVGNAALKQGPDTARGETIVYNMANDTLKVRGSGAGGAKIGAGGSDAAKPKRAISDPFKDDKNGPPEEQKAAKAKPKTTTESGVEAGDDTPNDDTDEEVESTPEVKPTRSGRSRLIISPK